MNISVYYCFPRSGGTLLNQCLLCHDRNVVLSEVNPAGSVCPPAQQADQWFDLRPEGESTEWLNGSLYNDVIRQLGTVCETAGKHLCLRDWSGPNFLPRLSPWVDLPSLQLEQQLYLHRGNFDLRELVFLRRSRAVYGSLLKNVPECADFTTKQFDAAYRPFLEQTQALPRFYFEDFVQNSATQLQAICATLGLAFAPDFSTRFASQTHLTGNNTLPKPTQSASWTEIKVPPVSVEEVADSAVFKDLDLLAGYVD